MISSPNSFDLLVASLNHGQVGVYIFYVRMIAEGGNEKTIGPFTLNIVAEDVEFVFPSMLINSMTGLNEITIQQPFKVEAL